MSRSATDVAVIGGGPAGSAAALTIARHTGRTCMLLEAGDYRAPRIGESVSPALLALLDYLGVPSEREGMLACYGSEAAWGHDGTVQRASIFSGEGSGWTLDRTRFDARLAAAAEAAGVEVRRGAVLRGVEREPGGGWTLRFDRGGAPERLTARQVIDASGRRAAFARRVGVSLIADDRLAAIAIDVSGGEAKAVRSILIESARDGWWYGAALPGSRAIVVHLTDADLIRTSGEPLDALFARRLGETRHIRARFGGIAPTGPPRVYPAHAQRLDTPVGAGWIAAGDAAASFDPLSSLGIGHALASGIQAARIAHRRLAGETALADAYASDVARVHYEHRRRRAALYASETRWPDSSFWRRRLAAAARVRTATPAMADPF